MIRAITAVLLVCYIGTSFGDGDLRPIFRKKKIDLRLAESVLAEKTDDGDITLRFKNETYVSKGCGYRKLNGISPSVRNSARQTNFAELPWTVMVFSSEKGYPVFKCGGSLIDEKIVLTAAHCVKGLNASAVSIRAGEYDTRSNAEPLPHQDRKVENITVHPDFVEDILYNDLALLFLTEPVELAENVDLACLPGEDANIDSENCLASGWGKDEFGQTGRYQVVLKSVDLSIDPHKICQNILRSTRLGKHFTLHESFICASGVDGADTCTGDGGGPLICPLRNDPTRYTQVGVVAWGIGCGKLNIPGVYANVINARKWIKAVITNYKINTTTTEATPTPAPITESPSEKNLNSSSVESTYDNTLITIRGPGTSAIEPDDAPQVVTQAPQKFPDFSDPQEKPEQVLNLSDQQTQQQQKIQVQIQQQQQQYPPVNQQPPAKNTNNNAQIISVILPQPNQQVPNVVLPGPQTPRFILVNGQLIPVGPRYPYPLPPNPPNMFYPNPQQPQVVLVSQKYSKK